MKFLFSVILSLTVVSSVASQIIYVNASNTGSVQDGFSWSTAFSELQEALMVASYGNEIWIARGTYYPDDAIDGRNASFIIPIGVGVFGGFNGSENLLSERQISENPTILSGDIGAPMDTSDNCYTVLHYHNPDTLNILDACIVEQGHAWYDDQFEPFDSPRRSGGGVYVRSDILVSHIRIQNCVFRKNSAFRFGGAVFIQSRNGSVFASIDSCYFHDNTSLSRGGGISMYEGLATRGEVVSHSRFINNSSTFGGAIDIYVSDSDSVIIDDCVFLQNIADVGAAIRISQPRSDIKSLQCIRDTFSNNVITGGEQGAVDVIANQSEIHIINIDHCLFDRQIGTGSAHSKLGLSVGSSQRPTHVRINRSVFNSDLIMLLTGGASANAVSAASSFEFTNSQAFNSLGPQHLFFVRVGLVRFENALVHHNRNIATVLCWGKLEVLNSLFSENISSDGDRGLFDAVSVYAQNSIFWKNKINGFQSDSLYLKNVITDIRNSDSLYWYHPNGQALFPVNIEIDSVQFETDPEFASPLINDYRVRSCSPAINAGSNIPVSEAAVVSDFDGNLRIIDEVVDIGPYEHPHPFGLDLIAANDVRCFGENNGSVDIDIDGVDPLVLSWTSGAQSGVGTNQLEPGNYWFTLTDGDFCRDSIQLTITEPDTLHATTMQSGVVCDGDSSGLAMVFISGGTPPYTVAWSDGTQGSLLSNAGPGVYLVTVTDSRGCEDIAQTEIFTIPVIEATITQVQPTTEISHEGSIDIQWISGGVPPYQILWEDGSSTFSRDSLMVGTYHVSITDSVGCRRVYTILLEPQLIIGSDIHTEIWPNPIHREMDLNVRVSSGRAFDLTLKVYDAVGREVAFVGRSEMIVPGVHVFRFPLELPYGMYVIQLLDGTMELGLHKIAVVSN